MTDQSDDEAELAAALALSMGGTAAPPSAATDDQGALQVMEICGCTLEAANAAIAAAQGSVDLAVELILGGGDDEPVEEFKMTALVRTDLGMGVGKIAAQASHATLGAYRDACANSPDAVRAWSECGEPTIVLQVGSLAELDALLEAARARGLVAHSVSDAGRTEVEAGTKTVGCVGPGRVSEVDAVCRHLSLL